jgi:hypothetical protein
MFIAKMSAALDAAPVGSCGNNLGALTDEFSTTNALRTGGNAGWRERCILPSYCNLAHRRPDPIWDDSPEEVPWMFP